MYSSAAKIHLLVQKFEQAILPAEEWTHHAHLTVGLWHLQHYDEFESIIRLRSRIISLNNVHGTPNTAMRGYHETITLFWVWILKEYICRNNFRDIPECYNEFLSSKYQKAGLLFQFYTREFLFTVKARAVWVGPDIKELDFDAID